MCDSLACISRTLEIGKTHGYQNIRLIDNNRHAIKSNTARKGQATGMWNDTYEDSFRTRCKKIKIQDFQNDGCETEDNRVHHNR